MTEQSRGPAGGPDGGQFSGTQRSESDTELSDCDSKPYDRGIGWRGTFYAAPDFDTAEQVINYFAEHLPPDTAVAKLRRLVSERAIGQANARLQADVDVGVRRWDQQNPPPLPRAWSKTVKPAAFELHKASRRAYQASLTEQLWGDPKYEPSILAPYTAFCALQVMRRWKAAKSLSPHERDKLDRSESVPVVTMSHQEVIRHYGLDEFTDRVLDPEADQREILNLLRHVAVGVDRSRWTQNQIHSGVESAIH